VHADVSLSVGEHGGVVSTTTEDPSKHVQADVLPIVGVDGGVFSTTTEDTSKHVQADEELFDCGVFLTPDLKPKNTQFVHTDTERKSSTSTCF
jgi:hypothetical protein